MFKLHEEVKLKSGENFESGVSTAKIAGVCSDTDCFVRLDKSNEMVHINDLELIDAKIAFVSWEQDLVPYDDLHTLEDVNDALKTYKQSMSQHTLMYKKAELNPQKGKMDGDCNVTQCQKPHPFTIDGVECASMEGFLQSLKFPSMDMQEHVCTLVGRKAKFKGKKKKWWTTQTLHWRGNEMARGGEDYQKLLDRAYDAMGENTKFQKALLASGNATLKHSMGKTNINETILTVREFCGRLEKIRTRLQEQSKLQLFGSKK